MDKGTLSERRESAEHFCRENLTACCAEILEWQNTGLLVNGKVRELAKMFSYAGSSALPLAESQIKTEACRAIVLAAAAIASREAGKEE